MALFRFSVAGEAEPVNSYAASLAQQAENRMAQGLPPPPPMPGLSQLTALTRQPLGSSLRNDVGLRRTDQIVWIRQGWIPIGSATYDYTYINTRGRKQERLFAAGRRALELVSGTAIGHREAAGEDMLKVAREHVDIRARCQPKGSRRQFRAFGITSIPCANQQPLSALVAISASTLSRRRHDRESHGSPRVPLPFFAASFQVPQATGSPC